MIRRRWSERSETKKDNKAFQNKDKSIYVFTRGSMLAEMLEALPPQN